MASIDDLIGKPNDWDTLFPEDIPYDPTTKTFEVGLVLGGTVSAGAYTSGVVDFLIEALDEWQKARVKPDGSPDTTVPDWKVKIKVVTGTSGGGITAAVLARALAYKFPHIRANSSTDDQNSNPFYSIWVNDVQIDKFLDSSDISPSNDLLALLNTQVLDDAATKIYQFNFPNTALLDQHREFVDNPFTVFITLTNLRGIPYRIDMGNGFAQEYIDHADYVRLAVFTQGFDDTQALRPDEFVIGSNLVNANAITWDRAVEFALGTSAFPVGLKQRDLVRPISHYRYRPVVFPDTVNPVHYVEPNWDELLIPGTTVIPDDYHFTVVDGGVTNNEPIALCRNTLAGYTTRNPRDIKHAYRAIILIDPFAESATLGPSAHLNLFSSFGPLLNTWKEQARYDTRDLLLAGDPNVFSRFMITAQREGTTAGGKSIATACADAFGGFLHPLFRRHDFLLGRKNCQDFLKNTFFVSDDNHLVANWAINNPTSANIFSQTGSTTQLVRLIPLYGACQAVEATIAYPKGVFNVNGVVFQNLLKNRIVAIVNKLDKQLAQNVFEELYLEPIIGTLKDKLQNLVTKWLQTSLQDWGL